MKNTRKRRNTYDARVLYILMDGEVHTQVEIADTYDTTPQTIFRAVKNLKKDFIIHTFRGGKYHGGIYLDPAFVYYDLIRAI